MRERERENADSASVKTRLTSRRNRENTTSTTKANVNVLRKPEEKWLENLRKMDPQIHDSAQCRPQNTTGPDQPTSID